MTAAAPAVSFIIPAHNAAGTLRATADSLVAQTVHDWEAIVVDDGSRDRTARIGAALAATDRRFRFLRQDNAGPSAARNRGLDEAHAERVVFVDADDWLAPDFLAKMLPLADDADRLPYCGVQRVLPSGTHCPQDFCTQLEHDPFSVLLHRCEPAIHCVVSPIDRIRAVGGFDAGLRCCEDWDLWLRLVRSGCRFVGVSEPLAFYRMRPGSLSTFEDYGARAANLVMRRARSTDLRLPRTAPFRGPLRDVSQRSDREFALARELCRVSTGLEPSPEWLRTQVAAWHEIADKDPEAFASFALHEMPLEGGVLVDEPAVSSMIAALQAVDPEAALRIGAGFDLYRAKHRPGQFGRYRSITLDGGPIPEVIAPANGTDALVLRLENGDGEPRHLLLPLVEPVSRADIVSVLLANLPVSLLIRHYSAYRSPRFWLRAFWSIGRSLMVARLAFARDARGQFARALRAGTAAALQGSVPAEPVPTTPSLDVPIVLVPRIVANDSAFLEETIGAGQLGQLFACLAAEGYTGVSLQQVVALRERPVGADLRPFAMVFLDLPTAQAAGQLAPLQPGLESADILLSPEELDAIAEGTLVVPGPPGGALRYGLRIDALPDNCERALGLAHQLLTRLHTLNGDSGPVAALTQRQGLDDAILHKAGFAPILSPAASPLRLSAHGSVFPAIDCSGAEGLGNVIECLRAA